MPRKTPTPADLDSPELEAKLEVLQEITLAMNSTLEPERLIERVLDASIRYTGANTGSLMLIRDGILEIAASRGLGANVDEEVRLRVGEGITGWVAERGQPLNVPDVARDERYVMVKRHIRSEMAVPMTREDVVFGVISVDSSRLRAFDDEDLRLLTIVANQAAQILENARVFSALRRKTEEDEILLEIGPILSSALDLESIFHQVMAILGRRLRMERGVIALVDHQSGELAIDVAYGLSDEEVKRGRYAFGEGIIGRVMKEGKPIGVADVSKDPDFLGRTGAIGATSRGEQISFFGVPIPLEGEVVGVLGVDRPFVSKSQFEAEAMRQHVLLQ